MCARGIPIIDNDAVYDSDDEFSETDDPEYVDSDATSEDDMWLGDQAARSRVVDRCRYIRLHRPVLQALYDTLVSTGRNALGDAFLQECSEERFFTLCYCNTIPRIPAQQLDFPIEL